jgi:hypothetical protein
MQLEGRLVVSTEGLELLERPTTGVLFIFRVQIGVPQAIVKSQLLCKTDTW